jgi:hypothetical protein
VLTHPPRRRFTVFEAANADLREIYLTATAKAIFEAMADFARDLPPVIAHWKPEGQHIEFRSLEFDLTDDEAQSFIKRRLAKAAPADWKYLLEAPSRIS